MPTEDLLDMLADGFEVEIEAHDLVGRGVGFLPPG
jgi:hypothetical protein